MTTVHYETARGSLTAGTKAGFPLTLTALSGLSAPGREYKTRSFLGIDGQTTVSSSVRPRTVTLALERRPDCFLSASEILRILSSTGTLTIAIDERSFVLTTNQVAVPDIRRSGDFLLFTAQYVCDEPYFTEPSPRRTVCFEKQKNIRYVGGVWNLGTRSSPVVWTSTNSKKTIVNDGDAPCEPTIVLVGVGSPSDGASLEARIESEDGTILSQIVLNYAPADGETVVVNCDGRKEEGRYIRSSKNGDILSKKSSDTSLSKFRFPVGKSVFRLLYRSESGVLSAYADYAVRYEGVSLWK